MRQEIIEFYKQEQSGGLPVRSSPMVMFLNPQDTDLKDILDVINWMSDPMEIIKYLSEIPLQEVNHRNYIRKHDLQTQLHQLIQADLRQAI